MDVQMIARGARLHARKIRYIVDQRLLPGMRGRVQMNLAGRPRSFTELEGYFIACAALLFEGGARRNTIMAAFARLADMPWPLSTADVSPSTLLQRVLTQPRTALEALYYAPGEGAQVLIGDGVNLRLKLRGADSGWIEPRSLARLDDSYHPSVVVQLDLQLLQAAFVAKRPSKQQSAAGRRTSRATKG
jgi:hypothetical protein